LPTKALDEFSLTSQARRIWDNILGDVRMKILNKFILENLGKIEVIND